MATITAITIRNVVKGILGVAYSKCNARDSDLSRQEFHMRVLDPVMSDSCYHSNRYFPQSFGVLIYVWTTDHTTTAYSAHDLHDTVGFLDIFLKPLMMGKGAPVPMLIIFLGYWWIYVCCFIGLFTVL